MAAIGFFDICAKKGWRADPAAGIADGIVEGVAFRVILADHSLLLSVSLPEKALPRLQQKLLSDEHPLGNITVTADGSRVRITSDAFPDDPEVLCERIVFCVHSAVKVLDTAYSDRHISGTAEPISAYLCGIAGAVLGALVGIIPRLLAGLIGWQFWLLAGVVGVASFYGYKLLRGAHRTGFAITVVLIASLVAVLGCELTAAVIQNRQIAEDFRENPEIYSDFYAESGDYFEPLTKEDLTLFDIIVFTLTGDRLYSVLTDSLFGLAVCGVGVLLMKGHIQDYTHSSAFLRSRRFR